MEKQEVVGTLDGWAYDPRYGCVWGYVYGDTKGRFSDGTLIHTSSVAANQAPLQQGGLLKTRNSVYRLGKPSGIEM